MSADEERTGAGDEAARSASSEEASGEGRRGTYQPTDWRESFREAAPYLGLGMQIAVSMIVFVGGGYLLDRWLGTLPWMTVLGAVVGLVGVIALIVRVGQEGTSGGKSPGERTGREEPGR